MKTKNGTSQASRRHFLTSSTLVTTGVWLMPGRMFAAAESPVIIIKHQTKKELNMPISAKPLRIDIPVRLKELRIAFSIADLAFEGDLPACIFHLQLIMKDIADWNAKSQVIAVFHTNAGHVTLHDEAYNAERKLGIGNPYKQLLAELMKSGVEVELCGATATVHKWGNEDLLPGVKVNTDAMARMSQLVQDGFVQITEWD